MGFAVIVSEFAAKEGEEVPEGEVLSSPFVSVVGWLFWYFTKVVFLYSLVSIALNLFKLLFESPLQVLIFVLILSVVVLLLKYVTVLYGLALGRMVVFLREDHMFANFVKIVLVIFGALIMIFCM